MNTVLPHSAANHYDVVALPCLLLEEFALASGARNESNRTDEDERLAAEPWIEDEEAMRCRYTRLIPTSIHSRDHPIHNAPR